MVNRLGGQYSADHWTLLGKHQIKTADKVEWLADEAVRQLLKASMWTTRLISASQGYEQGRAGAHKLA